MGLRSPITPAVGVTPRETVVTIQLGTVLTDICQTILSHPRIIAGLQDICGTDIHIHSCAINFLVCLAVPWVFALTRIGPASVLIYKIDIHGPTQPKCLQYLLFSWIRPVDTSRQGPCQNIMLRYPWTCDRQQPTGNQGSSVDVALQAENKVATIGHRFPVL